jgi:AAA+ ATPase superfamily predicted ATPase
MGRIQDRFFLGKAVILLGPRQSGKTTLIKAVHLYHRFVVSGLTHPVVTLLFGGLAVGCFRLWRFTVVREHVSQRASVRQT